MTEPLRRITDPNIPLNVYSRSDEALGRALSNFAHTPFELDGRQYASIEAFYNGLKWLDPVKRADIATLYGTYAKSAARKAPRLAETEYMGQPIKPGSAAHHALIERAMRAKLEQNLDLLAELVASRPREIVHDTRHTSNRKSNFPDSVFVDMLTRLRDAYVVAPIRWFCAWRTETL